MINIIYPSNFVNEREYILDVIFCEFLGINVVTTPRDNILSTSVILENGNMLEIADGFFNGIHNSDNNYLDAKNIPKEVICLDYQEAPEKNIIGIYGKPVIHATENNIYCGIDLFASAFYMLTRWEEYVKGERDKHARFPAKFSLAYKHGFLERPIVNEYVEIIWLWLNKLGIDQARKARKFQSIITHDIDKIWLFENKIDYLGKVAKAFLYKKNINTVLHHTKLAIKSGVGKDPYCCFEYLMDMSEIYEVKSHFFFMHSMKTKYDNGYDITKKEISNIIKKILDRGHIVGIHPSYETLNNPDLLSFQVSQMREITGSDIVCGRQHFLRFDVPNTWQQWDDNNIQWDSSLAYSEQEGFRCGVCYSYPVFNIITRKKLKLRERPLIIMDGTLVSSRGMSPTDATNTIEYYINKVRQYSGEFVLLWHNSSFEYLDWKNYKQVYESALMFCKKDL